MQYKSSFFLFILKILGFFWCEWDSCIPTLIAKNTRFFLFYQDPFEESYPHDTPSDWLLYRPLQTLLRHLTTFLESRCSVIFILNPLPVNFSKNICHISDNYYIYKTKMQNNAFFLHFFNFFDFLLLYVNLWTKNLLLYQRIRGNYL